MVALNIIVVWATLFFMSGLAHAEERIVIGSANGPISQVAQAVLREAYQNIGVTLVTKTVAIGQGPVDANRGVLDGEPARVAGLEARFPHLVRVPVPVIAVDAVVFTNRAKFKVNGFESLRPYRIGVLSGVKFAADGTHGMQVESMPSNEQLFTKLEHGDIDVVVTTRIEGVLILRRIKAKQVTMLEPPLETIYLYHYLNERHRDLAARLTESLRQMDQKGRIRNVRHQTLARMLAEIPAN